MMETWRRWSTSWLPRNLKKILIADGGQAVGGVEQAYEPGHETTLDDIEDLLSGSDNDDLY